MKNDKSLREEHARLFFGGEHLTEQQQFERLHAFWLSALKERDSLKVEEFELRGIAKILDSLWDNSANERDMSVRIRTELVYFFGKNWTKNMYKFIGTKGSERPELPRPLKEQK